MNTESSEIFNQMADNAAAMIRQSGTSTHTLTYDIIDEVSGAETYEVECEFAVEVDAYGLDHERTLHTASMVSAKLGRADVPRKIVAILYGDDTIKRIEKSVATLADEFGLDT